MGPVGTRRLSTRPAPGQEGGLRRASKMLTGRDQPREPGCSAGKPPRLLESPKVQLPLERRDGAKEAEKVAKSGKKHEQKKGMNRVRGDAFGLD